MEGIEIPRRMEIIQEYRSGGGFIAAVFPIYYPRELLRAFEILPVEVWGPPNITTSHGASYLQPYVCSIVHNALSFLLEGGLEVVDLLLVPHACDSLQGLGSILIDFISPRQPVLPLYLPRGNRESDISFLANELHSVYQRLEAFIGRSPSEADLVESIQREERADALLSELHRQRLCLHFSNLDFYRLIRSREFLPAERFSALAQEALLKTTAVSEQGIPILLSGIVPEPMSLFEALAEMGGCVVADDLACCGRRLYPAGKSEHPFRRMAERILYAPPNPMLGSPIQERLVHLQKMAESSGAKGVVFYIVKFCEPELFDLPQIRQGLRDFNLPSLVIEADLNDQLSQPVLTRLAAFLEMVQ